MSNSLKIKEISSRINPSSISGFILELRSIADEMEGVKTNTPFLKQSYEAALVLDRYNLI